MSIVPPVDTRKVKAFRRMINGYYNLHGRDLPWRKTTDPYRILVSEVMLQQTQVSRVIPKYDRFMVRFPHVASLALAPLEDVLGAWQGLGYNRRALSLKRAAEIIVERHDGAVPEDEESLDALPGIGRATARSIQVFAFNRPVILIETNIRAVFLHYFFKGREKVSDTELEPVAEAMLDRDNPRRWYNGLMDYGTCLKKAFPNPARASAHHTVQAPFQGSLRQVRGAVLRLLLNGGVAAEDDLPERLGFEASRIRDALSQLEKDGLVLREGSRVSIPGGKNSL
ncbi:MAG: A/G-specific adenine glycosylase [Syntrophales bacterium]|nr:A/G-specific adenine glycosylase [Syntrophales bacterium]MCK9527063.1 A/G-specific adenine glycosylase [Syntrophales bacterium]MDX9921812.1 hypothetical protein [Syntrophales bacterium]